MKPRVAEAEVVKVSFFSGEALLEEGDCRLHLGGFKT
jgi:hypothetical protein